MKLYLILYLILSYPITIILLTIHFIMLDKKLVYHCPYPYNKQGEIEKLVGMSFISPLSLPYAIIIITILSLLEIITNFLTKLVESIAYIILQKISKRKD